MTYGKNIHATILTDHAKGATAEEIQHHIVDVYNVKPCTNTIYAHIRNITTQDIIDELQRQQERDISTCEDKELKLKYRNELLKLLMPIRQEIIAKSLSINKTEISISKEAEEIIKFSRVFDAEPPTT